ncbi:MAG: glycosyltransferase [Prevotella sp.]|nr:glycosyltransferase [Prevotella sp.]
MDISVIIPVYNVEQYLRRCVDSVLHQENVSFEIILVDDGSTDSSGKICDEYTAMHPEIKCIHTPNTGPSTAKNVGYDIATGNYVAFIDSDDEIKPNMFTLMLRSGYQHNADIVCCNYTQIDEDGNLSHTEHTGQEYVLSQEDALKAILIKDKIYSQCWTKIYKRATMQENGVRNTEGLKTEEDFIYNIRAFACSKTVCIVDKPLYIYTHREKSLSKDYYRNHISQYIDNRILRLELVDSIIHERFPHLQEYSTYHCIFYYNELIGRVCLFPKMYNDARVYMVINYIKKHHNILIIHHDNFGFSKVGTYLIRLLPPNLYLYYRRWKSKRK